MEWLIEGHLTRRDAIDMVTLTEQALPKMKRVDFRNFKQLQIIKLKPGSIYEFRAHNVESSKNSGIMVIHQIGLDSDAKENAVAHVLASMLNGPAFNYLRT